jgi:hypothetical protein
VPVRRFDPANQVGNMTVVHSYYSVLVLVPAQAVQAALRFGQNQIVPPIDPRCSLCHKSWVWRLSVLLLPGLPKFAATLDTIPSCPLVSPGVFGVGPPRFVLSAGRTSCPFLLHSAPPSCRSFSARSRSRFRLSAINSSSVGVRGGPGRCSKAPRPTPSSLEEVIPQFIGVYLYPNLLGYTERRPYTPVFWGLRNSSKRSSLIGVPDSPTRFMMWRYSHPASCKTVNAPLIRSRLLMPKASAKCVRVGVCITRPSSHRMNHTAKASLLVW